MEKVQAPVADEAAVRYVAVASMLGTILEWYDFFLYGFTAALVFGKLFFPTYSTLAGTLASFGTLALGFVARPLGGVLFGHFGDRIGRKTMLIITISLMGGASFAIGLLPGFDAIGVTAPIVLTILRFVQGIGLGGEWGGAVLLAIEHAPRQRQGLYGSIVQLGAGIGLALATAILFGGSLLLNQEAFLGWGWRIPFLASILLLAIGLYIRFRIEETPAFRRMRQAGDVVRFPVVDVIRQYPKEIACTTALYLGGITVPFYTVWVFLTYYATAVLHVGRTSVLLGIVVTNVLLLGATLGGGVLADRAGRRLPYTAGVVLLAVFAFPFFRVADLAEPGWIWLAMLMFGAPQWLVWGALPALFSEYFPTNVRYTGISLGSQLATIIGGFVPMFATAVLPRAGTWPVSVLVVVCELLALAALLSGTRIRSTALGLESA
ncbi:MAG TPA: MFS transporter [Casimicrobiaceae bacterium]|nr:MFS transporter [Casimicrobiaceae bacterium]